MQIRQMTLAQTVLFLRVETVFRTLIAVFGWLGILFPAGAQQPADTVGTAWRKTCANQLGYLAIDECALVKVARGKEMEKAALTLQVVRKSGTDGYTVRFLAPLGVLLTKGLSVKLDDQELGVLGFIRCHANGCLAQTSREAMLVEKFKGAAIARVTVFETPSYSVTFSFDVGSLAADLERTFGN